MYTNFDIDQSCAVSLAAGELECTLRCAKQRRYPPPPQSKRTRRKLVFLYPSLECSDFGISSHFFHQFGTFLFAPSCSGKKQNFWIFKKLYLNETKPFKIAPGFLKDKTKLLVVSKKFWKRTRMEQKQQNESFRSCKTLKTQEIENWQKNSTSSMVCEIVFQKLENNFFWYN